MNDEKWYGILMKMSNHFSNKTVKIANSLRFQTISSEVPKILDKTITKLMCERVKIRRVYLSNQIPQQMKKIVHKSIGENEMSIESGSTSTKCLHWPVFQNYCCAKIRNRFDWHGIHREHTHTKIVIMTTKNQIHLEYLPWNSRDTIFLCAFKLNRVIW